MSPTNANSIVLKNTLTISVATNQPIPVVWGEVEGQPNAKLFSHIKGRSEIVSRMSGRIKIGFKLNCTLTGSKGSSSNRADTVVAFLAINNVSVDRSVSYGSLYEVGGGLTSIISELDNLNINTNDVIRLYLYRLTNNGTIVMRPNEASISIELTTVNNNG
jgi:hypothetical protein